jgi:hypothetical protein
MIYLMKPGMDTARDRLLELLEATEITAGMYVRVHGDHLIVGRNEPGPDDASFAEDRVRLTRLGPRSFGLSVKRHTGRWQRTPFTGSLDDVVNSILEFMQHLVAPY